MYDAAARAELREDLGYEQFVLATTAALFGLTLEKRLACRVVLPDNPPNHLSMRVMESVGQAKVAEFVTALSPLLFAASYKTLDLFFEWVSRQNGDTPQHQFKAKVQDLRAALPNYQLPVPFDVHRDVVVQLFRLYEHLLPYRNAVIHQGWGSLRPDGSLVLDFADRDGRHQMTLPFDDLLSFAGLAGFCTQAAVSADSDPLRMVLMEWLCDRVASLCGGVPTGLIMPELCHVTRTTIVQNGSRPIIDLAYVRAYLQRTFSRSMFFDLRIEAKVGERTVAWDIPYHKVPDTDQLVLDQDWDTCLAT